MDTYHIMVHQACLEQIGGCNRNGICGLLECVLLELIGDIANPSHVRQRSFPVLLILDTYDFPLNTLNILSESGFKSEQHKDAHGRNVVRLVKVLASPAEIDPKVCLNE